jgi:hypothetical protein
MLQILVAISLNSFVTGKRHGAMQKFEKKRKIWTQICPRYLKQWVLRCLPKNENKDSPVLTKNISKFQKRDMFSRRKVELG